MINCNVINIIVGVISVLINVVRVVILIIVFFCSDNSDILNYIGVFMVLKMIGMVLVIK